MAFKNLNIIICVLIGFATFGQDTLAMKEVYIDNDLVYKMNGERLTGVAQSIRKNGHLVYEEIYNDGVVRSSNLYFNGKEKIISDQTIYQRYKPWVLSKEIQYNLKGEVIETVDYDEYGIKKLVKRFENGELSYYGEYNGKKKHGKEYCFTDEGEKLEFEYINGKQQKKELP
ncbi:hypothetical protein M3P19_04630 [Muricauda sp. 2012CJ35-5]|uniref:Toxin-antitoxin system YwqK family antitoxin n=1 Tax=Flagellimonas spongiicola TaxID=2942208 RepID=A0ABT0PQN2_9FLAO|nr:hypothetical protein [Allomuricauda spongiicola]MCL6273281.1 hypothetical protein [Allomuricauda spongiicola]